MDAEPLPPTSAAPMSLFGRLFSILAAPGEVFDAVRASAFSVSNWLVPALINGIVGVAFVMMMYSQPALTQQLRDAQDKAIQQRVEQGKMTSAQADQAREMMSGIGMTIGRVAGSVGVLIASAVIPLWWAFLAWAIGRFVFRTKVEYSRMLEVAGLAGIASALGGLVGMFLTMGMGNLYAGPHLGFLVKEFDPTHRGHLALAATNLFGIWHLSLVSLGLAKWLGRPFLPVAICGFGVAIGYKGILILLGQGQFAL